MGLGPCFFFFLNKGVSWTLWIGAFLVMYIINGVVLPSSPPTCDSRDRFAIFIIFIVKFTFSQRCYAAVSNVLS